MTDATRSCIHSHVLVAACRDGRIHPSRLQDRVLPGPRCHDHGQRAALRGRGLQAAACVVGSVSWAHEVRAQPFWSERAVRITFLVGIWQVPCATVRRLVILVLAPSLAVDDVSICPHIRPFMPCLARPSPIVHPCSPPLTIMFDDLNRNFLMNRANGLRIAPCRWVARYTLLGSSSRCSRSITACTTSQTPLTCVMMCLRLPSPWQRGHLTIVHAPPIS